MAHVTRLLDTPRVVVGEFLCPPDDDAWRETNTIGDMPHVVFPLVPVEISQVDKGSILATPNHTILYDAGQLYDRGLRSDRGDHCIYVSVRPGVLERLAGTRQQLPLDAPLDRTTYLARHVLTRRLRSGEIGGREAERETLSLVRTALKSVVERRRARREHTFVMHRELVEEAKRRLASSLRQPVRLTALARALHTSPFHLARVFRSETGFTVEGYRRALRLRAALELLPTHSSGLTALALELGFSSHSHFTESFRREFGVPPSALR